MKITPAKRSNQLSRLLYMFMISAVALGSCTVDDQVVLTGPPNAAFIYSSSRVFPVQVDFVNTSSSPFPGPSTYVWDFGDGTVSTVTNPAHVYTSAGTYLIKLVQQYANSTRDTVVKSMTLNTTGPSGVSSGTTGTAATDFTFSIPSIYLVTFTNTSSNAYDYLWSFGDGSNSTSVNTTVTHQYSGVGPFMVTLNATGNGGADTCRATINF